MEGFERRYEHIVGRPLVACLPFFIAGLMLPESLWFLLLVPIALPFARRHLGLAVCLFTIGFARNVVAPSEVANLPPGDYAVTGRVVTAPSLGVKSQRLLLDIGSRNVLVFARASRLVMAGDRVQAVGKIEDIPAQNDPYGAGAYWARRGVRQQMNVIWQGGIQVLAPGSTIATLGSEWRADTWSRLRRNLPLRQAGIAMAIVSGQQGLVERDVVDSMQRAGTLHLLATSGFNVLLLAAALMFLLSHLPLPRSWQVVFAMLVLLAYTDAVGGRAPVVRAVIMSAAFLGAFAFGRSPDALSALALAAVGYLLLEPAGIYDAGFHLSFAAAAGLILFMPGAYTLLRAWANRRFANPATRVSVLWAGNIVAATLVAQAASTPLLAAHFGIVSLVAPLGNLLTAVAVPVAYVGAAAAQIGDAVWEPIGRGFDRLINGSAAGWVDAANSSLGGLQWSAIQTPKWHWSLVVVWCLSLLLLSRPPRRDPRQPMDE